MGNCQATDAATMVVQHPCGKVERFYWPVTACEIMKMNPGHYVALLLSTTLYHHSSLSSNNDNKIQHKSNSSNSNNNNNPNAKPVRLTRIKLLRPTDTLLLGHVYRLITTQEVMKGLSEKKHAKMNGNRQESAATKPNERSEPDKGHKVMSKHERQRPRSSTTTSSSSAAGGRSKTWQPKLQSITETSS